MDGTDLLKARMREIEDEILTLDPRTELYSLIYLEVQLESLQEELAKTIEKRRSGNYRYVGHTTRRDLNNKNNTKNSDDLNDNAPQDRRKPGCN